MLRLRPVSDLLRVPDDAVRRLSVIKPDIGQEQEMAQAATDFEKSLSVRQALRLYKRAVLCSAALSLAVVMEGYVIHKYRQRHTF